MSNHSKMELASLPMTPSDQALAKLVSLPEGKELLLVATVGVVKNDYVVAYLENKLLLNGAGITFHRISWIGNSVPKKGQKIHLLGLQFHSKGWRSLAARPIEPGPRDSD